jgi:DNA-binding MarR family transcriptional regulator
MEDSIRSIFTNEKPVMALVHLKSRRTENYASEISDKIDTTYSHTVKILGRFEDLGLVTSAGYKGRKKMLKLTDSGKELAEKAHEFVAELDEVSRKQGDA